MKVCVLLLSNLYLMASKIFYPNYAEVLRRSWRKKMLLSRKKVAHLHKAREEKYTKICCNIFFLFCCHFMWRKWKICYMLLTQKFLWPNYFITEDYHQHTKKSIFALKCQATPLPKKFILLTANWFDVAAENLVHKYIPYVGRVGY